MNRDQIVLIKGLLEKEYVAYAELANRSEDHPLFDKAQADYHQPKHCLLYTSDAADE